MGSRNDDPIGEHAEPHKTNEWGMNPLSQMQMTNKMESTILEEAKQSGHDEASITEAIQLR